MKEYDLLSCWNVINWYKKQGNHNCISLIKIVSSCKLNWMNRAVHYRENIQLIVHVLHRTTWRSEAFAWFLMWHSIVWWWICDFRLPESKKLSRSAEIQMSFGCSEMVASTPSPWPRKTWGLSVLRWTSQAPCWELPLWSWLAARGWSSGSTGGPGQQSAPAWSPARCPPSGAGSNSRTNPTVSSREH